MRAGEILGRAAVVREGGQKAGKVRDIVIDKAGKQVLGFVLVEGPLRKTMVASWSGVQSIGPDSIVFNPADSVVRPMQAPQIKSVLDEGLRLRGRRLQTTAGKDLGEISDLRFDEHTGAVLGYEVTGSLFSGRQFMPTPDVMEMGKDIIFVAPEIEDTIQKHAGDKTAEPEEEVSDTADEDSESEAGVSGSA